MLSYFEFIGLLGVYFWLAGAIFWAVATWAFASWGRIDIRLGSLAGGIFQFVGFIAIVIYYFAKKSNDLENNKNIGATQRESNSRSLDPFAASSGSVFAANTFSNFAIRRELVFRVDR